MNDSEIDEALWAAEHGFTFIPGTNGVSTALVLARAVRALHGDLTTLVGAAQTLGAECEYWMRVQDDGK